MRKIITAIAGFLVLCACNTINCPLNNVVYVTFGMADTLKDSLTVWTILPDNTNDTLINREVNVTSMKLSMSYGQEFDTWVFSAKDALYKTTINDTIRISKDDQPHFESVDCGPVFFHTITDVSSTNHLIQSVTINNSKVDYDASKTNIKIQYGSRD